MKLTATLPDGTTATRRTDNAYTFVAVGQTSTGWEAISWHSTRALALAAANRHRWLAKVVPVNAAAPAHQAPAHQGENGGWGFDPGTSV